MLVKNSTLAEDTYQSLKKLIFTGHYAPGQRLQIEAVSKELGVSPTPLREAFFRLEKEGLLEIIARRGTYVRMLDQLVVQQSYEIREVLEGLSARLAAINASQSNVDDLIEINRKFKNAVDNKDVESALELDIAFHYRISALSNNKKLQELIKNYFFTNLFSNTGTSNIFIEKGDRTYNGHQAIIHAIENHDPVQAEKIMRDQIRQGVNMVLSVLNERQ
jgi:DNA-binding GntR family transcriptional regulator